MFILIIVCLVYFWTGKIKFLNCFRNYSFWPASDWLALNPFHSSFKCFHWTGADYSVDIQLSSSVFSLRDKKKQPASGSGSGSGQVGQFKNGMLILSSKEIQKIKGKRWREKVRRLFQGVFCISVIQNLKRGILCRINIFVCFCTNIWKQLFLQTTQVLKKTICLVFGNKFMIFGVWRSSRFKNLPNVASQIIRQWPFT